MELRVEPVLSRFEFPHEGLLLLRMLRNSYKPSVQCSTKYDSSERAKLLHDLCRALFRVITNRKDTSESHYFSENILLESNCYSPQNRQSDVNARFLDNTYFVKQGDRRKALEQVSLVRKKCKI